MEATSDEGMREAWKRLYGKFPALKKNSEVTENADVYRSKWGSNPLFQGSWSFIAKGSSGDDIDRLASPITCAGNRGVFCSPLQ